MPFARKIFNRMNGTVFNNKSIRKVPINRNSLFYDEGCYNFDLEVGKDYTEQDMGQTVILYQVDASLTQANAVYGETKPNGVKFKTPIEIPCVYKIEEPELKSYDKSKNLATYVKNGRLTLGVYQESLDELGVEIKKGDYVGVQVTETHVEYFCVANDGKNNYDNEHSAYGVKPLYRTVSCYSIDPNEIFS